MFVLCTYVYVTISKFAPYKFGAAKFVKMGAGLGIPSCDILDKLAFIYSVADSPLWQTVDNSD